MSNLAYSLGLAAVGADVTIWPQAKIVAPEALSIGDSVIIDDFVFIGAHRRLILGNHVHVAAHASITGGGRVLVSDFCGISSGARLVSLNPIRATLEDFFVEQVSIGGESAGRQP